MHDKRKKIFESELKLLKGRERHPHLQHLLRYLGKENLALDLGCGLLVNLNYLKNKGFKVVGVDIFLEMLREKNSQDVHLICADGLKLPFKNDNFGGLLLVDIIEHLPIGKMGDFMEEVKRVLKHDGVIFLHVPLEKSLSYRILNRLGMIWPKNPNHLHDYNMKEIKEFIQKEEYEILWHYKYNGIIHLLQYYLKELKPLIVVSRFLGRYFQNVFNVAYTACLSLRSCPRKK